MNGPMAGKTPSPGPLATVGPESRRGRRRGVIAAVLISAAVVVAGAGGYFYLAHQQGAPGSSVIADGPTFYEALKSVNLSADLQPGSPWVLEQVYGVASPIPANPSTWGWGEYDRVLASCQPAFNGLTIWNGSIPLFHGTFNSGTAPFWQFVYFSNSSQELLVGTDVEGAVHVYPPISWSSECATSSGLGYGLGHEPWLWKSFWGQDGYPADSPTIANNDWNIMAKRYVAWLNRPVAEMYLLGATYFGSGMPPDDQINFFTCGLVGAVGATPGLELFGSHGVTKLGFDTFNYTLGCTPTGYNWTAVPMRAAFSNASIVSTSTTEIAAQEFRFDYLGSPPLSGPAYNAGGVTSWMVNLSLRDSNGQLLSVAVSQCSSWVPSVSDCPSNASGWYAVLLAPDGAWDGSYGAGAAGATWSSPVAPIANNETLDIVVPSTWNLTGDTLTMSSTTSGLPLTGSITLS